MEICPPELKTIVKKHTGKDKCPLFFKPIKEKPSANDFLTVYSLLKLEQHKEIIQNLITSSTPLTNIKNEYVVKNLKIIMDAYQISQAELDQEISGNRVIAKLMSNETRFVNDEKKIEEICQKLTKAIQKKISEKSAMQKDYSDTKILDIGFKKIFDNCQDCPLMETDGKISAEFYDRYPIVKNDLYFGRIEYTGEKKDYFKYDNDWLAQMYKALKPLERKMIFNLLYEMLYAEMNNICNKMRKRFNEIAVEIPSCAYDDKDNKRVYSPKEHYIKYCGNVLLNRISKTQKAVD